MLGHGSTSPANVPSLVGGTLSGEKCVWVDGGQDHTVVVTARGHVFGFGSGGPHLGAEGGSSVNLGVLYKMCPTFSFSVSGS